MDLFLKLFIIILCFLTISNGQVHSSDNSELLNQPNQKITNLYQISDSLYNKYEFEKAKKLIQQNLYKINVDNKTNSEELIYGMYKLALCEFELGNYRLSDSLLTEAIQLQNEIDSTNLISGRLWYKKSEIGNLLCDCKEIIPMAEKAVTLLEQNLGKTHPEVAYALEVLAYVLAHDYKYEKSIKVLHRSLKILEDNFGIHSPKLSRSLCFISRIYLIQYDYENGMPYLDRAINNIKNSDIESRRELAETYFFKSFLLYVTGDYESAQKASLKSIELAINSFGEFHPRNGHYSSILSRIYLKLGKYELAEPLMLKIKNIFEKTFGNENPVRYYSYINLGELYISQGRIKEAEYYLTQCLNIPNIKESLRIGIIFNLAEIYLELGQLEKAEQLCKEVIKFRSEQFGESNPLVALTLKLLAKVYLKQNEFIASEKTYFSVLNIIENMYSKNSLYVASTLFDMAQLYMEYNMPVKAEECLIKTIAIRTKKLLPGHPLVANSYLKLAESQIRLNKINSSFENMVKGLKDRKEFITRVFQYASSEQKLLYIKDHPLIYDPLLILALKYKSDKLVKAASEMILQGKALVIDALSVDKTISVCEDDQEISLLVERYSSICTRISAIALSTKKDIIDASENNNIENLYKTRDSLEAELSMNCAGFNSTYVDVENSMQKVSSLLQNNTLYIDYIKFHPNKKDLNKTNYLAFSLDNNNKITFIDLGDAGIIDNLIFEARKKIQESRFQIFSLHAVLLENKLKLVTNKLFSILVEPFYEQLKGKEKILIAPDSEINLVPFEIFVNNEDEYLIEKFEISYLSSGRDILQHEDEINEPRGLFVIASPDFDSKTPSQKFNKSTLIRRKFNSNLAPSRSMDTHTNCFENAFSPLSYSQEEGQKLVDLFNKKFVEENAMLYYGEEATTMILSNLQTPRYVHISTHGFFCQENNDVYLKNPLLRSGLAFTGANYSIVGDKNTPFTFDDGLLTALEVTGLNLVGTELVTLSACETGIGETVSGEGVFGLRRAFQIAGAKSILMSMWKIPDKETSDLMVRFYEKLFSGSSKQKALRESALEILKESREKFNHGHPYLWGGFILTGHPN